MSEQLRRLVRTTPVLQVASVVALALATALSISGFVTLTSIYSTLILAAFLGIAAAGQTIVILLGALDLSVPAIITAANLISTMLSGKGWQFEYIGLVLFGAAAAIGAANGYLIHRSKASPLIITLATGAIVTGITLAWTNGGSVSGQVPQWLTSFSSPIGTVLGVRLPPVLVLWVAVGVGLTVMLKRTVTGRHIYAIGANARAAELAGVKSTRSWVGAFALSAVSAMAVGILLTGFTGTGELGVGDPYLFTSLAAVLVGGTSLVGARGDYMRTMLGALILTLISTLLLGHGADASEQEMLIGALILMFVGIYGRDRRVRDRV